MTVETPLIWSFVVTAGSIIEARLLLPKKPLKSNLITVSTDQQITFNATEIMTNGKYQIKQSGSWSEGITNQKVFGDVELKTSNNGYFELTNDPIFNFDNSGGTSDCNVSIVINYDAGN